MALLLAITCVKCPNEQCKPILNIYVPRAFQWYKKRHKPLSFDPWNRHLKFWESTGTPSPKVGVALGVWGFTPSHFPTLPGVCDVTPWFSLGPHPCNPFCLGHEPKVRVVTPEIFEIETLATLGPITSCVDLWLRWGLKQIFSPRQELFNNMWRHLHANKSRRFLTFNGRESNWHFDSRFSIWNTSWVKTS